MRGEHEPLQVIRQNGFLAVPLPGPYPHKTYGRWNVECEISFQTKPFSRRLKEWTNPRFAKSGEQFRRLKNVTLYVPDYAFNRRPHSIESHAEQLWLPFDPAGVSLGHELGTGMYGTCRSLQCWSNPDCIVIAISPPDEAIWISVEAHGSIMTRIRFSTSLEQGRFLYPSVPQKDAVLL